MKKVSTRVACMAVIYSLLFFVVVLVSLICTKPFRDANTLIAAIREEDITEVKDLLDSGIDPNQTNMPVSGYWTFFEFTALRPISVACETGNLELVKLLIAYGATAEYIEHTGWSPLRKTLFRTEEDDLEMVQMLLANGANPQIIESGDPSVFAAANMYPMLFGDEGYTTNYSETVGKDITMIVELLLADQHVDLRSESGNTLLMYAAQRGNYYLVEYLLARGCDITLTNAQGETARDLAAKHEKWDVVKLLDQGKT